MTQATVLPLGAGRALRLPWAGAPGTDPGRVDLRPWLTAPVVHQGDVPLCTAAVVTAAASYFARRERGEHLVGSVLFSYRTSRMLAGRPDRFGSRLVDSLSAWRLFGVAPEPMWPFDMDRVDRTPPVDCFEAAQRWAKVGYARLGDGAPPDRRIALMRAALAVGLPVTAEFPLHPNQFEAFATGVLPLPPECEAPVGAHVVLIVGYNERGFLIRNSWGPGWGEHGHGLIPYEFARRGLIRDVWLAYRTAWTAPES
jgi:C1A family cysteine protease